MKCFNRLLAFCILLSFTQCQSPASGETTEDSLILRKTFYSSGNLKSEYYVKQDSLKEKFYKEYTPEGQLHRYVEYKNGLIHGAYLILFPSGDTASLHIYQNGIPEGKFIRYYENGQIWQAGNKYRGNSEGITKEYYEDGSVSAILNYKKGVKHQDCYWYYPAGQLKRFAYYGNIGQTCFQVFFTPESSIRTIEGKPIADLTVKADDFKRKMSIKFNAVCFKDLSCEVYLSKILKDKTLSLDTRQNDNLYFFAEEIKDKESFTYHIKIELSLPGEKYPRLFEQRIKVVPGKKLDFAML